MQVAQGGSQCAELQLFMKNAGLPETREGLSHIIFFTVEAAGALSQGVTTHPTEHRRAQTLMAANSEMRSSTRTRASHRSCTAGEKSPMYVRENCTATSTAGATTGLIMVGFPFHCNTCFQRQVHSMCNWYFPQGSGPNPAQRPWHDRNNFDHTGLLLMESQQVAYEQVNTQCAPAIPFDPCIDIVRSPHFPIVTTA